MQGFFVIARIRTWTYSLEVSCSIQLSYATYYFFVGWQDSNLRPPAPKAGAITGLRYTPKTKSGETGTRTLRTVTVDRLAICSVTTRHLPIIVVRTYLLRLQMYIFILNYTTFSEFFQYIF